MSRLLRDACECIVFTVSEHCTLLQEMALTCLVVDTPIVLYLKEIRELGNTRVLVSKN